MDFATHKSPVEFFGDYLVAMNGHSFPISKLSHMMTVWVTFRSKRTFEKKIEQVQLTCTFI